MIIPGEYSKDLSCRDSLKHLTTGIGLLAIVVLGGCVGVNLSDEENRSKNDSVVILPENILQTYRTQTFFTDPGEFAFLYDDLPRSYEKICMLIKKQLIHPMEASKMPDIFPKDMLPEDGIFPTVSDMLRELAKRDRKGLTMDREPRDRLMVACYHHGLLLASILRHQGKPVRLRSVFARYFEKQTNVRFTHVVCEVWNPEKGHWDIIDPDRNMQYVPSDRLEFPKETWSNSINKNLPEVKYLGSLGQKENVFIHCLLLDMAFVLCNERNYWHTPEFIFKKGFDIDMLDREQLDVLDQIAVLMNDPEKNIMQLEELYDENPFVQTHERPIEVYYGIDN